MRALRAVNRRLRTAVRTTLRNAAWTVLLVALLPAADAGAATVLRWTTEIDVAADGSFVERVDFALRLDDAEDVDRWSRFPVALDEHRRLEELKAWVEEPGGERRKVRRKEQDLVEAATGPAIHSSQSFHLVEPEYLRPGETLAIRYVVKEKPYFPGGLVGLTFAGETIESLDIRVRVPAAFDGWRWHVDGRTTGLEIVETGDGSHQGVRVRGRLAGGETPPELAAGSALAPVLRFAWGPYETWEDVGRWYARLLDDVPSAAGPVRDLADQLLAGVAAEDPRAVLDAFVAFVRRRVRYVAVEVGIGGYRPSPPSEVLDRRWGDCKDKSLLLIDLLRLRGIDARPALVRLAHSRRIDPKFPTPYGFNHLVVAIPADALGTAEGLPLSAGHVFVDPTQSLGGAAYLHGAVRGQDALVILEDERIGRLVPTPPLAAAYENGIELDLGVHELGHAIGTLSWRLEGDPAAALLAMAENTTTNELRGQLRGALGRLIPGTRLRDLRWETEELPVPRFDLRAAVEIRSFLQQGSRGASLRLPELAFMPAPGNVETLETWTLANRLQEVVDGVPPTATGTADDRAAGSGQPVGRVEAGRLESRLVLSLPPGICPPRAKQRRVENDFGLFALEITPLPNAGGGFEVHRVSELRRSWIRPADLDDLRELALAEHRAGRRRVRLRCP